MCEALWNDYPPSISWLLPRPPKIDEFVKFEELLHPPAPPPAPKIDEFVTGGSNGYIWSSPVERLHLPREIFVKVIARPPEWLVIQLSFNLSLLYVHIFEFL